MKMQLTKPKTKKEKTNSSDLVLAIRIEPLTIKSRLQPKANKQTKNARKSRQTDGHHARQTNGHHATNCYAKL